MNSHVHRLRRHPDPQRERPANRGITAFRLPIGSLVWGMVSTIALVSASPLLAQETTNRPKVRAAERFNDRSSTNNRHSPVITDRDLQPAQFQVPGLGDPRFLANPLPGGLALEGPAANGGDPNGGPGGNPATAAASGAGIGGGLDLQTLTTRPGLSATMRVVALLTVLSLAPSILMMTTCFTRFIIVLSLLRQALGTQQLPPNQVLVSLALFLTFVVMTPVWTRSYNEGILPYTDPPAGTAPLDEATAVARTLGPLREFMADQIDRADNAEIVFLFLDLTTPRSARDGDAGLAAPETYDQVPTLVLVPAYLLSELKQAFLIGFQIYLPFVVIDLVISAILISMGMMMLPPTLISLPFKLLLFVLIDGWFLTVGMLLESVQLAV